MRVHAETNVQSPARLPLSVRPGLLPVEELKQAPMVGVELRSR
jgi:hypothetical protein